MEACSPICPCFQFWLASVMAAEVVPSVLTSMGAGARANMLTPLALLSLDTVFACCALTAVERACLLACLVVVPRAFGATGLRNRILAAWLAEVRKLAPVTRAASIGTSQTAGGSCMATFCAHTPRPIVAPITAGMEATP
eukprot:CAMPEP_0202865042 /NCGR_PEP_ID=MMETSP1391-20130828/5141_1 /ASSEMBLY_ACC=CAM_ASM_000867 /TAXON_ID=1034604 /ORGANISM="Chlamydomonas leiostraca, Strain SAG 11-49" /LENGTH=139 /DNA_ID=CAMNT_0049544829 /DNA_START=690 /DNA_END=1109 /DNA_ORIENTATION=-